MDAQARQLCPLCRGELRVANAVRAHLISDHKRSAAEADELIARFDTARPIPEPAAEPHSYFAIGKLNGDGTRSARGGATAPEMPVE